MDRWGEDARARPSSGARSVEIGHARDADWAAVAGRRRRSRVPASADSERVAVFDRHYSRAACGGTPGAAFRRGPGYVSALLVCGGGGVGAVAEGRTGQHWDALKRTTTAPGHSLNRITGASLQRQGDKLQRIGAGAIDGHAPVEVRPSNAAGGPNLAEQRASVDQIARLHSDGFEVPVEGVEAEPVIDDHRVPGEIKRLGEHHAATLRRVNRSARGSGEIDSAVRRACFAVEDAALAEVAARGDASERVAKMAVPQALGGDGSEDGAEALALGFGAGKLLRIGLDEIGRDLEAFGGKFSFFDRNVRSAGEILGGLRFAGDGQRVRLGL